MLKMAAGVFERIAGVEEGMEGRRNGGWVGQGHPTPFILWANVDSIFHGVCRFGHLSHEGGTGGRLRDTGTLVHAMGSSLAISIRLWELSSFAECCKGVLKKRNLFDPGIALAQG